MYKQRKDIKNNLIKITELIGVNIYNTDYITEKLLEDANKAGKILIKLNDRDPNWIDEYNRFVQESIIRHEFLKKYDKTLVENIPNSLPFY